MNRNERRRRVTQALRRIPDDQRAALVLVDLEGRPVSEAAEILGVPLEDILVYSSDTDFTPFDVGAYASSTTYMSGAAVVKAAQVVAEQLMTRAAMMLNAKEGVQRVEPSEIVLANRLATAPDGRSVSMAEIGHHSLHHADQLQIMGVGSFVSPVAPPPFAE